MPHRLFLLPFAAALLACSSATPGPAGRPETALAVHPPTAPAAPLFPDQSPTPDATREAHRLAVAAFRAARWQEGCDALESVSERRALTDYLEAACRARLGEISTAENLARQALQPQDDPPSLGDSQREGAQRVIAWVAAIQDALLEEAKNRLGTLPLTLPARINPTDLSAITAWRQRGAANNIAVYNATRALLPPTSLGARLEWNGLFENANPAHLGFIFSDFPGFPFPSPPNESLPDEAAL